jgi:hypothetical protein
MKLNEMHDEDVQMRARTFDLPLSVVQKLYNGDPVRLTYMWVKQGHVNYATFQKLLRYISES